MPIPAFSITSCSGGATKKRALKLAYSTMLHSPNEVCGECKIDGPAFALFALDKPAASGSYPPHQTPTSSRRKIPQKRTPASHGWVPEGNEREHPHVYFSYVYFSYDHFT